MITDMEIIRHRVSRGEISFSMRVLLTALIKGDERVRGKILMNLERDDFSLYPFVLIFDWIRQSLQNTGQIDSGYLYQQAKQHVYDKVVTSQIEFIDRVLATPLLASEKLNQAVYNLQMNEFDPDDNFYDVAWTVIVALLKGDRLTQERILIIFTVDDFDINLDSLFQWAGELYTAEGRITREGLHAKGKQYVINELMGGYLSPVDYLFALEMPDDALIEMAIKGLKRRENIESKTR